MRWKRLDMSNDGTSLVCAATRCWARHFIEQPLDSVLPSCLASPAWSAIPRLVSDPKTNAPEPSGRMNHLPRHPSEEIDPPQPRHPRHVLFQRTRHDSNV